MGKPVATWQQIDAGNLDAVVAALAGLDVFLCGTPFEYIPVATEAALRAGVGHGGLWRAYADRA